MNFVICPIEQTKLPQGVIHCNEPINLHHVRKIGICHYQPRKHEKDNEELPSIMFEFSNGDKEYWVFKDTTQRSTVYILILTRIKRNEDFL